MSAVALLVVGGVELNEVSATKQACAARRAKLTLASTYVAYRRRWDPLQECAAGGRTCPRQTQLHPTLWTCSLLGPPRLLLRDVSSLSW